VIGPFTVSRRGISAPIGRDYNLLIQQLIHEILVVLDDPGDFPMFLSAATGLESERAAAIDPALDFLLPPMSADPQEAARLRALTEDTLRSQKSARLRTVCNQLNEVLVDGTNYLVLDEESTWNWLGALTDMRLALAGELGIHDDSDLIRVETIAQEKPEGTREQSAAAIYLLMTWWQESLLKSVHLQGEAS